MLCISNSDLRELDLLTHLELGPQEFMSSRAHEHLIVSLFMIRELVKVGFEINY